MNCTHKEIILPKRARRGPVSRRWLLAVAACAALPAGAAAAATGGQLSMRNHSPFAALAPATAAPPPAGVLALTWNASSHSLEQSAPGETLSLDGETHTVTLRGSLALGGGWRVAAALPFIAHGGGMLDGSIDAWHRLWGLPEGRRPEQPRDGLRYEFRREGAAAFTLDDTTSGIGDIQLALAWQAASTGWRVIAGVSLPSGSPARLTGARDSAAWAGAGYRAAPGASRWDCSLDAGVLLPPDPGVPGLAALPAAAWYEAAAGYRLATNWRLVAQVAGNTALFDSRLKATGRPSLRIGAGIAWRPDPRWDLVAGFAEDLRSGSAPDFGIELSLVRRSR